MINTDLMRSHPDFGSDLLDPKDRAALDEAWERKWFKIDPSKETLEDTHKRACKEYKIKKKELARLKLELSENFGGAK